MLIKQVCMKTRLISFYFNLLLRFTTKNGNVKTICHLFSRRPHSQNRHAENALFVKFI